MRVAPPGFRAREVGMVRAAAWGGHGRNQHDTMTDTTQQLFLVYGGALLDPTSDVYAEPGNLDVLCLMLAPAGARRGGSTAASKRMVGTAANR